MATKRTATTELNHENWNEDTPSEEAGLFQVATKEELSRRVVKKAKRRLDEDGTETASPFSGFSGFGTAPTSSSKPFDFLKPTAAPQTENDKSETVESNGISFTFTVNHTTSNGSSETPPPPKLNIPPTVVVSTETSASSSNESGIRTIGTKSPGNNSRAEYLKQLHSLNESLVAWIKQHVDKNPFCILTPIFHDYEKYLQEIEQKYIETDKAKAKPLTSSQQDTTPKTSFTSFKCNPMTNSSLGSTTESKTTAYDESDEYQPPKNEVQEVKEEGAIYSKRCKLFYKKDTTYVEKGVGKLYLKPIGEKTQLLVRAETCLGNILLNINLSPSIPVNRVKNNVSIVCIPNPPLDTKNAPEKPVPVTFLIRVKDEACANELLQKLSEFKV